ncbi:uncharacterized protein LOC144027761 [Festucalex cinctus]
MADDDGVKQSHERRLVIIGARRSGKSSSANTILRKERFECGRTRTAELEARHEIVKRWNLFVVDTPGWKNSSSLRDIPKRDKQQLKLCGSKCPPGPHVFLIVIPTDSSFSFNQRETIQEHMKLLGERAWRYTMVLFTFGDYLGQKTIEQHIESEGDALTGLVDKCGNRYHVFNNKDKSNPTQVIKLMEKIDHMVYENENSFYMLDEHMSQNIKKKQEDVAEKAEQRWKQALEQRKQIEKIISEMEPIQELRIILLGSQLVGKTSVVNTILAMKEHEEAETMLCQVRQGSVGRMKITVVDTPGWRKGFTTSDTTEMIKDELLHSMCKCPPGPHVFLLVIDTDASFNAKHLEAATTHVELFGENVWQHTMVVFTHGDWLRPHRIEEYIEGEGKALQSLVEQCGNRYHVLDNMNADDSSQVDELLGKIILTLAENAWQHFTPDEKMLKALKEKEIRVERAARLRHQANSTRTLTGPPKMLNTLRILLLGEKMSGKTTAANYLLLSKVFPTQQNEGCIAREVHVAGRQVIVVDTPGWYNESECTREQDQKIVHGLTLSPAGFDAVLIAISLDCKFNQTNQDALEDHVKLFGDNIWNHTMVLFTNVDTLADRSLEVFIEREHSALQWLVDKCGDKYHCLNITDTSDVSQHNELFKKIEDMSAENQGCLFNPDMNDISLRIEKKFWKRKIKTTLQHMTEQALRSQALKLFKDFKEKLVKLQEDINDLDPFPQPLSDKGKDNKKSVASDIEHQIEELNMKIMESMHQLRSSMDISLPNLSGSTQEMDKVLDWLSQLQIRTTQESTLMLNNSESSGYKKWSLLEGKVQAEGTISSLFEPQEYRSAVHKFTIAVLADISTFFTLPFIPISLPCFSAFGSTITQPLTSTVTECTHQVRIQLEAHGLSLFVGSSRPKSPSRLLGSLNDGLPSGKGSQAILCRIGSNTSGVKQSHERRLVIIGARRSGKSSSANTILRKERFECGRTRTAELEARHEIVKRWNLFVVDTPGWKNSSSLRDIPKRDKQQLKLCGSKCPPGPHVFLIVIPTDSSFSFNQRETIQEHMKLLGERAWRYTMVLFTFGDYLGQKTIEQHIESEGDALTGLVDKCGNRYHVFNNKDKSNPTQVIKLMEKIDHMVYENENSFYMLDEHMSQNIKKKQEDVAEKAEQRWKQALEQRKQIEKIISEMEPIQELRIILLGSQLVGKTSVVNTILAMKEHEEARTMLCQVQQASVGRMKITVVDTPGWRKGFTTSDTTEMIKDELLHSMCKCPPGPHVFLLVIDADASFNAKHLEAATTHVELFGENVWQHTMVVFTHGDWLRPHRIEEYIEGEGKALQSLVEQCGNRYHVLDNMNADDSSQVDELLGKIILTLAENAWQHFTPDEKMLKELKEKEIRVERAARLRHQANFTRTLTGPAKTLNTLRILIIGEKMSGKTTAANCILLSKVFPTQQNEGCIAREVHVAGRQVIVVDTPGWYNEAECTREQDQKIVHGLTLSPAGFDAVLIAISLDCKFNQTNQDALEDHVKLFGDNIWNHTMVLFTNVDALADRSLEVFIEREHSALQWLVDKCGDKYHCLNITDTSDVSQHNELFKKIEDMSAENQGCLFNPDMDDISLRIEEKFQTRKIKNTLQNVINVKCEQAIRRRELELLNYFKEKLEKLQQDINNMGPFPLTLKGTGVKPTKKSVLLDIEQQITVLNMEIMTSSPQRQLRSSMDFGIPSLSGSTQEMDKVLDWLSQLQISTSQESTLSLNFSASSGYRSQYNDTG